MVPNNNVTRRPGGVGLYIGVAVEGVVLQKGLGGV